MKGGTSYNVSKQKHVVLYLDGPTRAEFDKESRSKIRKWLRKVWKKFAKKCVANGTPGPVCGVIAKLDHLSPGEPKVMAPHATVRLFDGLHREIATLHAPMLSRRPDQPFYGISRKRARDGLNFDAKYEFGMTVRVKA
ncbi:hypothetical protein NP233_g6857 [Leucocoprinus birnbaumii]|uniref:Uncharacterized protein n=1 Tax=Leucocoprinus birnbaumii TaxID=56174 RepID=A0AAD5VQD0_9AGAR|nr:hypothetical protein NP233_g6857 [Leucocoprinus birnbaumii]